MTLLASIIRTAAAVVVGIIVVAIIMVLFGANESNGIVSWFHDAGGTLAGPFKGLFSLSDHKANVAVNWGIAAIVYSIAAAVLTRLIAGAAASGGGWGRFGRRRGTVV